MLNKTLNYLHNNWAVTAVWDVFNIDRKLLLMIIMSTMLIGNAVNKIMEFVG